MHWKTYINKVIWPSVLYSLARFSLAAEFSSSVAQIGNEQAKITSQLDTNQNLLSQVCL